MRNKTLARIDLIFDEWVSVKGERYSYNEFNFLVEVGSALGLWIGFSALDVFGHCLDAFAQIFAKLRLGKVIFKKLVFIFIRCLINKTFIFSFT